VIPPVLPIWLLAGLPPDLPGAPHSWPPTADDSVRRATPLDPAAAAAAAATTPDEAGRSGSSRTCHLRSNHRAADGSPQAVPGGGDPLRQARRPLPGHDCHRRHLHLAARQTRPLPRRSEKHALAPSASEGARSRPTGSTGWARPPPPAILGEHPAIDRLVPGDHGAEVKALTDVPASTAGRPMSCTRSMWPRRCSSARPSPGTESEFDLTFEKVSCTTGSAPSAALPTRLWCSGPRCQSGSPPTLIGHGARMAPLGQPCR
jgi:hypothetical protein